MKNYLISLFSLLAIISGDCCFGGGDHLDNGRNKTGCALVLRSGKKIHRKNPRRRPASPLTRALTEPASPTTAAASNMAIPMSPETISVPKLDQIPAIIIPQQVQHQPKPFQAISAPYNADGDDLFCKMLRGEMKKYELLVDMKTIFAIRDIRSTPDIPCYLIIFKVHADSETALKEKLSKEEYALYKDELDEMFARLRFIGATELGVSAEQLLDGITERRVMNRGKPLQTILHGHHQFFVQRTAAPTSLTVEQLADNLKKAPVPTIMRALVQFNAALSQ